jgi:hypothetical protein
MIGEQLARSFIRHKLADRLTREEGWDHIVLTKNDYKKHAWTWNTKLFKYDHFREDFIAQGFYATRKLLSKYATAVAILEQNHCTPDGMLLKLNNIGRTRRLKATEAPRLSPLRAHDTLNREGDYELPIVDGDLEMLEIKCGRTAKLMDKQKQTYNDLIAKDIPLRLIRVRIVSFDLNRFLVEERRYDQFV